MPPFTSGEGRTSTWFSPHSLDSDSIDPPPAAIASLGTLGVPESLPFLLGLMEDSDTQIAAAAKAALQKINTAPRSTSKN